MRLGIKGKQVLGVTSIVGAVVVILSVVNLSRLASVRLAASRAEAELVAKAVWQRAREIVPGDADPGQAYQALRGDPGLRSILQSSLYSRNVMFAAIVDVKGLAVVQSIEGEPLSGGGGDLDALMARPALVQLVAIFSGQRLIYEFVQPLRLTGEKELGAIRVGVGTLLIREDLSASLGPSIATAFAALAVSIIVATLLAQLLLRPIHVIRSGLTRLGRGEFGVRLDLDQHDEFGELGTFFNAVSAQLSADRSQMAGQVANLESAVEHLEDAVAIVNERGEVLFANPAMRVLLPAALPGASLNDILGTDHPVRRLSEQTLVSRQSRGPVSTAFGESGERLVMTHAINDPHGTLEGIMVVAQNLEYLSQVQSTIRYSRKLAALGRLSAGVAHEVKNPLNAMMIHLELLRQQFAVAAGGPDPGRSGGAARVRRGRSEPVTLRLAPGDAEPAVGFEGGPVGVATDEPIDRQQALQHIDVIASEIRRLDLAVQGFLKFSRPEDLTLQPVNLAALFREVIPIVQPEADRARVALTVDAEHVPDVNGDPAMLRQAFLNLALNACQAMPNGGTLRIRAEPARGRRVSITCADTGVGIDPAHLQRIFDLYYTTKEKGSGIGLSMVYRTVQMHDGEIEVQSTPGAGTTFRVLLPQA